MLKTFEEFLKQKQKWPKFSISDIIKLYVVSGAKCSFFCVNIKKVTNCCNKMSIKFIYYMKGHRV